jgi:hypothetical protein
MPIFSYTGQKHSRHNQTRSTVPWEAESGYLKNQKSLAITPEHVKEK